LNAYGAPTETEGPDALAKARTQLRSGKFSDAIESFDKIITADPKCVDAYLGRARANMLTPDGARRSIADCDKAIDLEPKRAAAYDIRGTDFLILKDHEKALKDFDSAVQLDSKNPRRYVIRGNAYHNLKRYPEALKDYDRAFELKPSEDIYVNRARVYDDLGEYEKALKDSNKAIELQATKKTPIAALEAINYTNRGRAYLGLGEAEKAVTDLSKAASTNPRTVPGEAFYFRAKAYTKLGKAELATKDTEEAKKLGYKPE
jgi:tetratricopeptide (TPR) repeat protein